MKKTYIIPLMKQEQAEASQMLTVSGIDTNKGIGYGGVDNNGDIEPCVKEFLWDNSEED